jgi:hypothetical protein
MSVYAIVHKRTASLGSSVSIETRLWAGKIRNDISIYSREQKLLPSSQNSD